MCGYVRLATGGKHRTSYKTNSKHCSVDYLLLATPTGLEEECVRTIMQHMIIPYACFFFVVVPEIDSPTWHSWLTTTSLGLIVSRDNENGMEELMDFYSNLSIYAVDGTVHPALFFDCPSINQVDIL